MRSIHRALLTAGFTLAIGTSAFGQNTGTGGQTGGGGGGLAGGTQIPTVESPTIQGATITGFDSTQVNTNQALPSSTGNFLAPFYSNPFYMGLYSNTTGAVGGFGTPTIANTQGFSGGSGTAIGGGVAGRTTGARTGATGFGGTTGTAGRTAGGFGGGLGATGFGGTGGRTAGGFGGGAGGFGAIGQGGFGAQGGRGGFGGLGGQGGIGGQGATGQVIPLPRDIAYTAQARFPAPQLVPTQVQAGLRSMLDRSTVISNPQGVQIATEGQLVVLRGKARNEDEARLIEGMIRLTPGVRDVRNELEFPTIPPSQP